MTRWGTGLALSKSVKASGITVAYVTLECSVSRDCSCMLLAVLFIALGVHSLEVHRDCMVEEGAVCIVPCLFPVEREAELMTKDVMR